MTAEGGRGRTVGCSRMGWVPTATPTGVGMVSRTPRHYQEVGLAFVVLGVVTALGVLAWGPPERSGLLGALTGFILVGAVMFLMARNRRRQTGSRSRS